MFGALPAYFFSFLVSWKYWICLVFWYPGHIGDWMFLVFWYPGNTGNQFFLFSHILEIRAAGGRAEAGGRLQGLCCAALDYFWNMFLEK